MWRDEIWRQKTRIIRLPHDEEIVIMWAQFTSVTDRQTDSFTIDRAMHSVAR